MIILMRIDGDVLVDHDDVFAMHPRPQLGVAVAAHKHARMLLILNLLLFFCSPVPSESSFSIHFVPHKNDNLVYGGGFDAIGMRFSYFVE